MGILKRFGLWAGLSLCAFALQAAPGPDDVGKSWDDAHVYVPASEGFLKSPKDVKLDKPMPVVLFMHGCSGIQAALTPVAERGAIVSGWVCTSPNAPNSGLRTALDLPLLVLDHERDPLYAASPGRHCSEFFGARTKVRQVILSGEGHNTFKPDAQQPVLDFLNENLQR